MRATLALFLFCASCAIAVTACGGGGGTATPSADRTTGVADVDTVIHALTSRDMANVLPLLQFYSTPCTTVLGGGGPPKCAAGQSEGTSVSVFPYSQCEPQYLAEGSADIPFAALIPGGATVYAVVKQTPIAPSQTQRPLGSYGIVISFPTAPNAHYAASIVSETAGRIVAIQDSCDGFAKDLVAKISNPDFLLAPPK